MQQKKRRSHNSTLPAREKPMARQPFGRKPGKRLPMRNKKRQARRRAAGLVRGQHARWVAQHTCLLAGDERHSCFGPIHAHHVHSVGAGGDDSSCVPLCATAHTLSPLSVHRMGVSSFNEYWRVDTMSSASELWRRSPHNRPDGVR